MYIRILILAVLLLTFSSVATAQSEQSQTILIDNAEYLGGDCDIGARIDVAFLELNNYGTDSGAQVHIILYRGSEDLPANQTNAYLQTQIERLKHLIKFRKYDVSKIVFIDGGFRKSKRLSVDFWLVPLGGIIPQPTETVEQPKLPKNQAYLVDESHNHVIYSASFATQEAERLAEESQETDETDEPTETEQVVQMQETDLENTETEEVEIDESNELYWGFSNYFGDTLEADQNLRGTVIYYADSEEYDLKKSHELMSEFLQNYKTRNNVDLKRIRLIYGGFRKDTKIEYWIVPKGAKEPQPRPEVKKIEVEK